MARAGATWADRSGSSNVSALVSGDYYFEDDVARIEKLSVVSADVACLSWGVISVDSGAMSGDCVCGGVNFG